MIISVVAAPPIIVFALLALLLCFERILDFFNIPRSKLTYAKVVMKEDRGSGMGMKQPLAYRYRISFEFGEKQLMLLVPKKTYESVSVGSFGVLVHTDSRFRGFHVDKKIPDLVKSKKKNKRKSKGWR